MDKYLNIYKKYKNKSELINQINEILCLELKKNNYIGEENVVYETSYYAIAPTLILFIYEIMIRAKEKGIKRLYFLARDGYIFYKIAKILNELNFKFEIKYLYCSRISLRRSLYFKMDDYNKNLMFSRSKVTTINTILRGIGFEEFEIYSLYEKLEIKNIGIDKILNSKELDKVKEKINLIGDDIIRKSKMFLKNTLGYFEQEGLLDDIRYAIVDSGWNGSMQESIYRILAESKKENLDLEGFYFGIFRSYNENRRSRYNGWYFDNNSKISTIAKFNINLFESLTISNHGMTLYYEKNKDEKYLPVLKGDKKCFETNFEKIEYEVVINLTETLVGNITTKDIRIDKINRNFAEELLNVLMYKPSIDECLVYGQVNFSDSPTEENVEPICRPLSTYELMNCFLPIKVLVYIKNRLFINKKSRIIFMPFWDYGSIEISKIRLKQVFRFGLYQINYLYAYRNRKISNLEERK